MNAAQPISRDAAEAATAAQRRAAEPSMEEILASIRKIIADDDALPLAQRPAPRLVEAPPATQPATLPGPVLSLVTPAPDEAAADDPFHAAIEEALRQPLRAAVSEPIPAPEPPHAEAEEHAEAFAEDAEPEAPLYAPHSEPAPEPSTPLYFPQEPTPLISPDASVAVHASFQTLAASVMAQNAAMVEETIRGMLRPMLKGWLDDNLPVIVEKLVRAEIERVARGGR
jgi:uncharacterized protein